ncbi:MAG TPA: AAA family ATPase [Candidatus Aminicenantes bacterium]|nr:AAA family ATPase [Candidatus Aminicenantes bacterium]
MNTWLVPRRDLTPDQARAVEMPPTVNRIILGMAGSGKTQILIHRAAHLASAFRIPSGKYRVFVFTNVIKEYIRSGLEMLGLPESAVSTFDSWCVEVYEEHFGVRLPRKADGRSIDFPAVRRKVLGLVRGEKGLRNTFEFVLVDEGQDLAPDAYEIIREIARHVTVFVDPLQRIFDDGAETGYIFDRLGVTNTTGTILGAFRNADYVADLAAHFISDRAKMEQFRAQVSATQRVRERPLLFVASSFEQEMDRLAEVIRSRQVRNERIGIIVPTNRLLHGLTRGLADRVVEVEKAATREAGRKVQVTCSFENQVPKIATFFQAKGLTFDSVLLPRLTANAFGFYDSDRIKRMMFVGIARATQWAYLSTVDGDMFPLSPTLNEAAERGHLIIQKQCDWQKQGRTQSGGNNAMSGSGGYDDDFPVL